MINKDSVTTGYADGTDDCSNDDHKQLVILEQTLHIVDKGRLLSGSVAVKLICICLLADVRAEPENRDQYQRENNCRNEVAVAVRHLLSIFVNCRTEAKDCGHSDHRKDDTDYGSTGTSGCCKELTDSGIHSDNIKHCLISNGACCVRHACADIAYTAENDLRETLNRKYRKCQDIEDCQYRRSKHQIRAELTPAGVRAVCNLSHHRVVDCVPDSGDQNNCGNCCACKTDNVSIENIEVVIDHIPAHLASDLTEAIAYHQLRACFFLLNCSSFVFIHSLFPPFSGTLDPPLVQ